MSKSGRTVTSSGIEFGPNASGKFYIALNAHRGSRPDKSRWLPLIRPVQEYKIFCIADSNDWRCSRGHYWGIASGGSTVLGFHGERLSKFPRNTNTASPWHGYPVSPRVGGDRDSPEDILVEKWIEDGTVAKSFGRRVQRRKI